MVSAGPTITLSHDSWSKLQCRISSSMSSLSAFITTLCFGTGGAVVLGTSNSQLVMFSELFEWSADKFALFVKFITLDAPFTLDVCGFSIRFTTEASATFGDAFRGGNGGAVKLWAAPEFMVSFTLVGKPITFAPVVVIPNDDDAVATAAGDAVAPDDCRLLDPLLSICCGSNGGDD